jgi:hypothetical protein
MDNNTPDLLLYPKYNQTISITKTYSDDMVVPIMYYSSRSDVAVSLVLNNYAIYSQNGVTQQLQSIAGNNNLTLAKQANIGTGIYQFGYALTKQELPKAGTYTGVIIVKDKFYPTTTPGDTATILEVVPVIVNIENNPLFLQTGILMPDGVTNYSYAEILATLYRYLYISPRFVTTDENGVLTVRYSQKRSFDRVQLFRDKDNGALPPGSTITVLNASNGQPQSIYHKYPLLNTNSVGQDAITLEQISSDGKSASYCIISNLPIGDYVCFAEYVGTRGLQQTDYVKFTIN